MQDIVAELRQTLGAALVDALAEVAHLRAALKVTQAALDQAQAPPGDPTITSAQEGASP